MSKLFSPISAYDTASEISMPAATSAASSAVCPVCRDRDNSSSPVNTLDRRETVVSNQDMDVRVKELYRRESFFTQLIK